MPKQNQLINVVRYVGAMRSKHTLTAFRDCCGFCADSAAQHGILANRRRTRTEKMETKPAKLTTAKRRKAAGVCIRCGRPLNGYPHVRCPVCAEAHRDFNAGRRMMLGQQHKCCQCGKPMPSDWWYVECETCKYKSWESKQRRKASTGSAKRGMKANDI